MNRFLKHSAPSSERIEASKNRSVDKKKEHTFSSIPRFLDSSILLFLLTLVVAGCGEARSEVRQPVVATVAGQDIEAETFRTRYAEYLLRSGTADAPALRRAFLDRLVVERLMIEAARAEGIAREEEYLHREETVRRKLLLDAYAADALFDTLSVSEEELKAMYVRVNTTLTASHLYARTLEQADALTARLQAGERFEDLAKEVFADPRLAESGGSVGAFGYDEMDPAFEDAAYALDVGETAPPVRTAQGFSIIRLDDRFVKPILTEQEYAQKKPRLARYVRYRKQQAARGQHVRALTEALDVTFHDAALEKLLGHLSGAQVLAGGEDFDAWLASPLVSFVVEGKKRAWSVADFRARAEYTDERQRAQVSTRDDLTHFIEGLVAREEMLRRARAEKLDAQPAFAAALGQAMDEWVYDQAKKRVLAEVTVPDDSIRAYFAAHEAEFVVPERVQVGEILAATKAEAERLKALAAQQGFEAVARQHSLRPGADASGGDLGFLGLEQLGELADLVFDARAGDVLGPLEVGGHYLVLKIGERQPARPMAYEEARAPLAERLYWQFGETRLRTHADALRQRFDVVVHADVAAALLLRPPAKDPGPQTTDH